MRQGDYEQETVFGADPREAAARWVAEGASRLHVVDLDGARSGEPINFDRVSEIAGLGVPVQIGGGIRTDETARRYRAAGVARLILGTSLLKDPSLFEFLRDRDPEALVVSVDARDGRVATDGWTETTEVDAVELVRSLAARGARRFIYTDINSDGMLTEPNYEAVGRVVAAAAAPVVSAGGVADVEHVRRLGELGVEGVIIGRALYDGRVALDAAIEAAGASGGPAC